VVVSWSFNLWTILLVCKVDGAINWPWYYIFIPLWCTFPGYFIVIGYFFRKRYRRRHELSFGAAVWLWFCGLGISIWTVLLAIKLESLNGFIPWWWIFTPLWVTLALLYLVDENWPHHKFEFNYPMYRGSWGWNRDYKYETFKAFGRILPGHTISAVIIFTILLVLDLENVYPTSWVLKFIPFWWLLCLVWLIVFTGITLNPSRFDYMIIYPILTVSIPMVFLLLLGLYLTGVIETYLAVVWIPFWLVEIIFLFTSFCVVCWFS